MTTPPARTNSIEALPSMSYLEGGLVVLDGETGADVWIARDVATATPLTIYAEGDTVAERDETDNRDTRLDDLCP